MQSAYHARSLRLIPKLAFTITIGVIATVAGYKAAAQDVYTLPVGFIQVPLTNTFGGYNTMALPFQQLPNDQGLVSAVTGASNLTVACSTCATANYALATSLNYLQFETGLGEGLYFAIAGNDTSGDIVLNTGGQSLTTIGVASGDRYTIHPYWRVQDVFGPAVGGALSNGTAASKADNVLVWNGAAFTTYWPKTTGVWQGGVNGGLDPLLPDESVLILSRYGANTNIVTLGGVRSTNGVTILDTGYNLVGNSFPASIVLSNLNLIGSGSGFQGGSAATKSDQVLVWNGSAYDQLWYKTNSATPSWQGAGVGGAYVISPSSTYFIYLQHGTAGNWPRPLPYTVSTTQ